MVNRTIQMKRQKSKTVTAKSVQKKKKKWQKNIFLIDSGSTEQQVLHIKYL